METDYLTVQFPGGARTYTYRVIPGIKVHTGDTVLVDSSTGLGIARAVAFVRKPSFNCNWVLKNLTEEVKELRRVVVNIDSEEEKRNGT